MWGMIPTRSCNGGVSSLRRMVYSGVMKGKFPMTIYTYLSLIPEALVLSHLPPDQFGKYMAIGNRRKSEGPAVFFEVDPNADLSAFKIDQARARCVPHADGSPHRSIYVSVYDVIPRVPLEGLQRAYLTTPSGFTLALEASRWEPESEDRFFLYQELGPVYPRAASRLNPGDFCKHVTDPEAMVFLPRLAFIDLHLGPMAMAPDAPEAAAQMPYPHLEHLQECLQAVAPDKSRKTKIVNRGLRPDLLFYLIRSGLFIGDNGGMKFFPMPSEEALEKSHHLWWHSAQSSRGY